MLKEQRIRNAANQVNKQDNSSHFIFGSAFFFPSLTQREMVTYTLLSSLSRLPLPNTQCRRLSSRTVKHRRPQMHLSWTQRICFLAQNVAVWFLISEPGNLMSDVKVPAFFQLSVICKSAWTKLQTRVHLQQGRVGPFRLPVLTVEDW